MAQMGCSIVLGVNVQQVCEGEGSRSVTKRVQQASGTVCTCAHLLTGPLQTHSASQPCASLWGRVAG